MSANLTSRTYYMQGGVSDNIPEEPMAYAKRLTSYIRNASTVRVRTIENFGRSPDIACIQKMIDEHEDRAARARKSHEAEEAKIYQIAERKDAAAQKPSRRKKVRTKKVEAPVVVKFEQGAFFPWRSIVNTVAVMTGRKFDQIMGRSRYREDVIPRNIAMAALVARARSYSRIGIILERDHTTVMNGIKKLFWRDLDDENVLTVWRTVAPDGFKDVTSLEEFNFLLKEKK